MGPCRDAHVAPATESGCMGCDRDRLREELADTKAALEMVEWVFAGDWMCCPWCNANKKHGHFKDCRRRIALEGGE